jgi:hypothetical protein
MRKGAQEAIQLPARAIADLQGFSCGTGGTVAKSLGQLALAFEFVERSSSNAQECDELTVGSPPGTLRNVRHDRDCCSAHLRRDAEPLGRREALCQLVDGHRQVLAGLPCV